MLTEGSLETQLFGLFLRLNCLPQFEANNLFKLLSILHYAHPKLIIGPFFFVDTVTGDSYVKMLDGFPSILNETNDFVLLYAFKFRR